MSEKEIKKENLEEDLEMQEKALRDFESRKPVTDDKDSEANNKNIDFFSKFICTVNKPLYFIIFAIDVIILLLLSTQYINNIYVSYLISATIYTVSMLLLYKLSKKRKKRLEELDVHKVSIPKKIGFIALNLLVGLIASAIAAFIALQQQYKISNLLSDYNDDYYYNDSVNELAGETNFIDNFEDTDDSVDEINNSGE